MLDSSSAYIVTAVTGTGGGKNEKKTDNVKKTTLNALTATPSLPIRHGPYRTSSPFSFLVMIRMIGIK